VYVKEFSKNGYSAPAPNDSKILSVLILGSSKGLTELSFLSN